MTTSKLKSIQAEAFDEAFEDGDVFEYLDRDSVKARYPVQRLSIDFTKKMIEQIDCEAARIGVTRTSLIKVWIADRLAEMHQSKLKAG
jgi:hypothetical protein